MKTPNNHWLAIANYAEKYQAFPLAAYITFRRTANNAFSSNLPAYIQFTLKDMQNIAIINHVSLFLVNISN